MKKETLLLLPMALTMLAIFIIFFHTYLNLTLTNAMLLGLYIGCLSAAIIFLIYLINEA